MDGINRALGRYRHWDAEQVVAVDYWNDRVAALLIVDREVEDIVLLRKEQQSSGAWEIQGGGGSTYVPGWLDDLLQRTDLPAIVKLSGVWTELGLDADDGEDVVQLGAASGVVAVPVKGLRLARQGAQGGSSSRDITLNRDSRFFVAVHETPYSLYPLDAAGNELPGRVVVPVRDR